jgi:hypothetical protein
MIVEKFFKIEPGKFMSRPQLTTALRLSFGEGVIKSDNVVGKLYKSFDIRDTGEMDWRSLLYLLCIAMQPELSCLELMR